MVADCNFTVTPLPLVGISSCLVGNKVRYDGQHKFHSTVDEWIRPRVNLLPICPESMAGMGIPRPPIELIKTHHGIEARGRDNPTINVTNRIITMARAIANSHPTLEGFICQSRSPSCGFNTTPVFYRTAEGKQQASELGSGLFIQTLMQLLPHLVVVNECDLDKSGSEAFLKQLKNN